jgi:hypothetical protein
MWSRAPDGCLTPRQTGRLTVGQLRAAVVRSEKLVAEAGDSSGTQRKGNVRRWKPLPSNSQWRLRRLYVFCSYSYLWSVQLSETVVVTFWESSISTTMSPSPVSSHTESRDNTSGPSDMPEPRSSPSSHLAGHMLHMKTSQSHLACDVCFACCIIDGPRHKLGTALRPTNDRKGVNANPPSVNSFLWIVGQMAGNKSSQGERGKLPSLCY